MEREPRNPKEKLLNAKALFKSILQFLVIFAISFGTYIYMLSQNADNASAARSMALGIIMLANLFLVQVNSSDTDSIIVSIKRLSQDKIMWAVMSVLWYEVVKLIKRSRSNFNKGVSDKKTLL